MTQIKKKKGNYTVFWLSDLDCVACSMCTELAKFDQSGWRDGPVVKENGRFLLEASE